MSTIITVEGRNLPVEALFPPFERPRELPPEPVGKPPVYHSINEAIRKGMTRKQSILDYMQCMKDEPIEQVLEVIERAKEVGWIEEKEIDGETHYIGGARGLLYKK